jgi:2-methylisocitrate lyase-like PEP mutase family enzyme
MSSIAERRAAFRALHRSGCFAIPNPWDGGSAIRLAKAGFKALASTSAGAAWALGKDDGEMSVDEVLEHLRFLVGVTDLPINADFEAGFADSAAGVAANVSRCIDTGVAGLSIDDMARVGVRRVSVGAALAKATYKAFDGFVARLATEGRLP